MDDHRQASPGRLLLLTIGLVSLSFAAMQVSCASGGPEAGPVQVDSPGVTRIVNGDWNDVEAAALVGVDRAEATVRERTQASDARVAYDLRTAQDQRGLLTAVRAGTVGGGDAGEGIRIELFCRVGSSGHRALEERILDEVERRLEELRGVEFAPVDGP